MTSFAFIDASNIIYGTRNEGWKVDFKKLFKYLKERYKCKVVYYFGGLDKKNEKQQKFYQLLENWGYLSIIKPVKLYSQPGGKVVRKANCDVDLTFYAMKDKDLFDRGIFLTGDGDFEVLFKFFIEQKKQVIIIANSKRTAKELKKLPGIQFNDLNTLRETVNKA